MTAPPVARIAPVYQELYELLASNTVGLEVMRGFTAVGQDLQRMVDRATVVPAALLTIGTPGEDSAHGGIVSSRADPKTLTFSVLAIADDYFQCLQVVDICNDFYSGYQPANCSEISLVPGIGRAPVSSTVQPLRFTHMAGYFLTLDVS